MGHNTNKLLLGATKSSHKKVKSFVGTAAAGTCVRLKSDGTASITKSDGADLGISLGADLSDAGQISVVLESNDCPILIADSFDPAIGARVAVVDASGVARAYTGSGDSYINAHYVSGRVGGTGVAGGVNEAGALVGVARISFIGL